MLHVSFVNLLSFMNLWLLSYMTLTAHSAPFRKGNGFLLSVNPNKKKKCCYILVFTICIWNITLYLFQIFCWPFAENLQLSGDISTEKILGVWYEGEDAKKLRKLLLRYNSSIVCQVVMVLSLILRQALWTSCAAFLLNLSNFVLLHIYTVSHYCK